ncbi:hypothetical protein SAMN05421772_104123 [Paracoccus saliphilus]|uniref:Uncharacterized protein n=1 Tax=Paracoccus saliphilus TaxID=405559 RepID=A0AA45W3L8_9RHOB|nr:hypothetical protein SAMN05421772_104123 [Paracoccus saliphilus]
MNGHPGLTIRRTDDPADRGLSTRQVRKDLFCSLLGQDRS